MQISKWAYRMSVAVPELAQSKFLRGCAFFFSAEWMNYIGMFIVILKWDEAVQAYKNMWFLGNITMGFFLVASLVISPKTFKRKRISETTEPQNTK